MFKLVLEKAEEPEIKLPTSAGSLKKQESSRKPSISALLTMPKPLTVWITINWKILKEMGIPDHLTCFLRNLYAGQEATVRTGHGTTHWFQIVKGVCQGCILSLCLFNFYAEYIMRNAGLEEALAVQGTLKSLFQHHISKASVLQHSDFFIVQLSHPYVTTGKSIALTRWTFFGKVMSLLFNMVSRLVITFLSRRKSLLISCCNHHLQ